jgi:hypothetical protein
MDPTEDVPARDAAEGVPSVSDRVMTISPALAGTDTITAAAAAAVVDVAAVGLASILPAEDAMAVAVISAAAETCCSDLSWKRWTGCTC